MSKANVTLAQDIIQCKKCPRLIGYCRQIAKDRRKAYANQTYWGQPVPGFGDIKARVWIIGLAPAAHGANRTGRMFTGDKSGEWLYRILFETGFSNSPVSVHAADALKLFNVYISSVCRCAPPQNKPTPKEIHHCKAFLERERELLKNVSVIICLGRIAFHSLNRLFNLNLRATDFQHGREISCPNFTIICSYHPSQQNTFTKKLTWPMWQTIFEKAKEIVEI